MAASPQPMHAADAEQVDRANGTRRTPVVFIHGLWLLPSS
jgi:non-heme chloroperoxidase